MRSILLAATLIAGSSFIASAHAAVSSDSYYQCAPTQSSALYHLEWVKVRKNAETNQVTTEISFKTSIANIVYSTDVSYIENPKFSFPSWNGSGLNFITEAKARDFKAPSFTGCITGNTEDFDFSANLDCKLVTTTPAVKTLAKK